MTKVGASVTSALSWRPRPLAGLAIAAVSLAGCTVAVSRLRDAEAITLPTVVLIYLVVVVITAVTGGVWAGIAAAAASDAVVNWYFVPPYHTLSVEHRENLVVLIVYVLVAVIVSVLVDVAAGQREAATRHDLRARLQATRADELAKADQLRTAILRAVGHDLRTPLAAIKTAASSLDHPEVAFTESDRTELVATILESTDRLSDLVENLLALSRLQAGVLSARLGPVALDGVVARAAVAVHDARLVMEVSDDLPLVLADPGLLERVIANLVDNALRATRDGPVTLRGAAGVTVTLAVIDHGPGIAESELERVFAPFQRLDDHSAEGRLGLGLAIARGFTEAMGGTLSPSTTPGGGVTMTIELALA